MSQQNTDRKLMDLALEKGASHTGVTEVDKIKFRREFRAACAQNACGRYGKNWTCPPDCGDIDEMIQKAKGYKRAMVFQYIGELEDSYDVEGMAEAAKVHGKIINEVHAAAREMLGDSMLMLGAGGCSLCEKCTRPDNQPCRHPRMAVASLESYGVAVSELAPLCSMKYINGQNTVTYFGGILY